MPSKKKHHNSTRHVHSGYARKQSCFRKKWHRQELTIGRRLSVNRKRQGEGTNWQKANNNLLTKKQMASDSAQLIKQDSNIVTNILRKKWQPIHCSGFRVSDHVEDRAAGSSGAFREPPKKAAQARPHARLRKQYTDPKQNEGWLRRQIPEKWQGEWKITLLCRRAGQQRSGRGVACARRPPPSARGWPRSRPLLKPGCAASAEIPRVP
jgi:hypothetical protein